MSIAGNGKAELKAKVVSGQWTANPFLIVWSEETDLSLFAASAPIWSDRYLILNFIFDFEVSLKGPLKLIRWEGIQMQLCPFTLCVKKVNYFAFKEKNI